MEKECVYETAKKKKKKVISKFSVTIRPAYQSIMTPRDYVPLENR